MTHTVETLPLMSSSPGMHRVLKVHRFGRAGSGPKVYLQAALHANETPGLLILHHLIGMLKTADAHGAIAGEVVVVPFANPIGLSENVLGTQIGREALDGNGNFNRGFPDLASRLIAGVSSRLGDDEAKNTALVRAEMRDLLAQWEPVNEFKHLQKTLMSLAIDADFVFDIHTELDACVCLVVAPWCTPALGDLIADVAPQMVHSTDTPALFDTVCSRPWFELQCALGETYPIAQACVGATLEMRGVTDVDDATAAGDALGLMRFFKRRGLVAADLALAEVPGAGLASDAAAPVWPGTITAHEDIEFVRTPVGGVLVYHYPVGAVVAPGTVVADIVDIEAHDPAQARTPIVTAKGGLLYGRTLNRLVRPYDCVAKLAAGAHLAALKDAQ